MKAYLVFNLPEERPEYDDAINGTKNAIIIEDIWNNVFRPYYKYGYKDEELNKLLATPEGAVIIEKLAKLYQQTKEENV